ncbi:MAG: gliding motility-associated ABC transporter substrate-binding protein GldG [Sphingobacteriaceae bacterium]|nr:gliding motility-associated ABC transporter substrate-binding protein GldG [Sphingobacteriaceae bacterium]
MRLAILLSILIVINVLAGFIYTRFDLTREKRYSLAPGTKELLSNLQDIVYIKVYLEGDFPPGFQKLQSSVKDMLAEMRRLAGGNLEFEFVNPADQPSELATNQLYEQLYKLGLQPTDLQNRTTDGMQRKVIWPGAIVYYRNKEVASNFLLGAGAGGTPMEIINASEEALEYTLANAIKKATSLYKPRIAFTDGHGELDGVATSDIARALSEFYTLQRYDVKTIEAIPTDIDLLVIAKPSRRLTDWSKYKIDNFIMRGGKVLWLLDGVGAAMDSMTSDNFFMAMPNDLGVDDMLFKYGVRINADLIQDVKASRIPIVYGMSGGQPQQKLFPWFYFPLISGETQHPIVRNLDPISFQFVSSIDLIDAPGVDKSVLLRSSNLSRKLMAPVRVNLQLATEQSKEEQFNKPNQNVAVLLEGQFPSFFKNRYLNEFAQNAIDSLGMQQKEVSVKTKMIVISDGDVIRNHVRKNSQEIFPLGFDRYTNQMYGNKVFLMNAIDYLLDDAALINVRSKQITLRMLDGKKVTEQKKRWQALNLGLPVLLLIIFGFGRNQWRKRKYASKKAL